MKITIKQAEYIAKLAKLSFKEEDLLKLTEEFTNILLEFKSLASLELAESIIEIDDETSKNSLRNDNCIVNNDDDLMSNVKSFKNGYIEVPKIIE